MAKIESVSDNFHRAIQITPIEKTLLSTVIFNRLHNILQNGTAYLTYPTARTSRFSHSLGVMHLTDAVFRASLANASGEDRKKFLESIQDELKAGVIVDFTSHLVDKEPNFEVLSNAVLNCPLLSRAIPAPLPEIAGEPFDDCTLLYLCVLQAVRIAALLHDVGHPPFSHVTERVLFCLSWNWTVIDLV